MVTKTTIDGDDITTISFEDTCHVLDSTDDTNSKIRNYWNFKGRIPHHDIKQFFNNFSRLAIDQGLGKEAYGVAVQLHHAISRGGKMFNGSLGDILQSDQKAFVSQQNNEVTLSFSQKKN